MSHFRPEPQGHHDESLCTTIEVREDVGGVADHEIPTDQISSSPRPTVMTRGMKAVNHNTGSHHHNVRRRRVSVEAMTTNPVALLSRNCSVLSAQSDVCEEHPGIKKSFTLQNENAYLSLSKLATSPDGIARSAYKATDQCGLSVASTGVPLDETLHSAEGSQNVYRIDSHDIDHFVNAAGAPFGIEGPIPAYAGIFDMFKIGVGPSSSHTNGPMNIAASFVDRPDMRSFTDKYAEIPSSREHPNARCRIVVSLFGSLASTGVGHGTDNAVITGLQGKRCDQVSDNDMPDSRATVDEYKSLHLSGAVWIKFDHDTDFVWHPDVEWDAHPNGMSIQAILVDDSDDKKHKIIDEERYISLGGGFFVTTDEFAQGKDGTRPPVIHPYCFQSWDQLRAFVVDNDISLHELMYRNELAEGFNQAEVNSKIDYLIRAMFDCINAGCVTRGPLPLRGMRRHAAEQFLRLRSAAACACINDSLACMDYVSVYARAVNEQNACGCRVVTAPTNGACGIIPAVLAYYWNYIRGASRQGLRDFVAVAAAIGSLIKRNASISGAEAGCQAEVGSATAMAAGALCHVTGGSVDEVGFAAEMAIEHSLGLTCDPVGGLVVVPCIDRNALGSTKAIMCARLALLGRDSQGITLDSVIRTMFITGVDLQSKYRETALGGLAVMAQSPGQQGLVPSYVPLSCGKVACSGCNAELDDLGTAHAAPRTSCSAPDLASEDLAHSKTDDDINALKQIAMEQQTREELLKMINTIKDAESNQDGEQEDPREQRMCEACLIREKTLIELKTRMENERGINPAVQCTFGGPVIV